MAAAPFDPWGQLALELSCDYVLTNPMPPTLVADRVTHSTTRLVYRVHWNTITPWNDFSAQVIQYRNNVLQFNKQTNVMVQEEYRGHFHHVRFSIAGNTGNVRALICEVVEAVHSAAANGGNAPRPSD